MADAMIALGPGDAHLWWMQTHEPPARSDDTSGRGRGDRALMQPALLERWRSLMSEAERARHDRFLFEDRRREHLAARALCRSVLSRYAPVEPQDWRFVDGEHGRPRIDEAHHAREQDLRFNLTHSNGLIAIVVARGREVGMDVECRERKTNTTAVADRFFAAYEVERLRALPTEEERKRRFYVYWSLKESYIKARGLGLSIPLGDFWFDVDGPTPRIGFAPRLVDDPARWTFQLLDLAPSHQGAVCLERVPGATELLIRKTMPLAGDEQD